MQTNQPTAPLDRAPTVVYLAVAFGWSWLLALGGVLIAGRDQFRAGSSGLPILAFAFMFGPALGALAGRRRLAEPERAGVLGFGRPWNRWLVLAWLAALGLVAGAVAVSSLAPAVELRSVAAGVLAATTVPGQPVKQQVLADGVLSAIIIAQAVLLGPAINTFLLLTEELGWRGFLWSRWRPLGFWRSSGLIGVVWGLWHAPLIALGHNYPGMPVLGPILMVVFCVLTTPIINHLRERGGTVWHACLFHGTINATAGVGSLMLISPDWKWNGLVGLGGFIALTIGSALVAVARIRGMAAQADQVG